MSALRSIRTARRLWVERLEQRLPMCAASVAMQPSVELTSYEQEMLELINRARANPAAEAARQGISLNDGLPAGTLGPEARQPLAPNALLGGVAKAHTADMIRRAYFAHVNPDGKGPGDRAAAAGYYTTFVGENISARGLVELSAAPRILHDSLFQSAGHRVNTLLEGYREIGLGLQYGAIKFTNGQTQNGSLVTQLFGGGYPSKIYVTGVAYDDTSLNGAYNVGEGRAGIIVEARDAQGRRFATTSGSSGGYSLRLDAGLYRILAFSANRSRMLDLGAVNLTSANVKKDVHVENLAGGIVVSDTIVVSGGGQSWSMSDPKVSMVDVCRVDIRGTGNNQLNVDATKLRDAFNAHVVMVMANAGDSVAFDANWSLDSMRITDGTLIRRFRHGTTLLDLMGPSDYTNPIDLFDVNANGSVTSIDALAIVNELAARRYSVVSSGVVRAVTSIDLSQLKFFDVTGDARVTSLDALRVINEMGRRSNLTIGAGEQAFVAPVSAMADATLDERDRLFAADLSFLPANAPIDGAEDLVTTHWTVGWCRPPDATADSSLEEAGEQEVSPILVELMDRLPDPWF